MKLFLTPTLVACLVAFSGCNKDKTDKPTETKLTAAGFIWSAKTQETAEIKVVNQYGEPVEGAQILIGEAQGTPFRGNFLSTDRSGVAVVPADWTTPAPVTVDANGYIRQTLLNQNPGNIVLRLNSAYLAQAAELRGKVTELPVVDGDKLIDFALAMPLLKKTDLLSLQLDQVISPFSDQISAAGQTLNVPSNVSLPKQKESYFIGITLDKPVYRLKVPTYGPRKFVASRGRFVFKTVVDKFRAGKAFHEVINDFSILAGGISDASIVGPSTNLDIPGNRLQFNAQIPVNPSNPLADEVGLVLATSEMDGFMVPTDVKRVTNGKATNLQVIQNQPAYIINVIKKQSEFMTNAPGSDRMTASAVPYSAAGNYRLLPLIANPSIVQRDSYQITLPNVPTTAGINPVAISAVISDLSEVHEGQTVVQVPIRKWEVLGYGWNNQINLPKWPLAQGAARKRVEVRYIGSSTSDAQNTLDFATHVTHASTDF